MQTIFYHTRTLFDGANFLLMQSGSFNKGKRRRAVQPATASGAATVASTAQLLLRTGTTAAAGGAAIRRIPSACAGSGDDIGSCSGIAYAEVCLFYSYLSAGF